MRAIPLGHLCALACAVVLGCARPRPAAGLDEWLARHPLRPIAGPAVGQERARPASAPYAFLVAGHLYGDPRRGEPGTGQAASFLARLDELATLEPDFVVSLGDFVRAPAYLEQATRAFEALGAPVYNAVGNHDVRGDKRQRYEGYFGPTFGGFRIDRDLFLVLDTELDPWRISGDQLDFLREALRRAADERMRQVFVFAHRVLFAAGDERYEVVFRKCNSRQDWPGASNFVEEVRPLLAAFAGVGKVFWFSGDVGVAWSYGLFHDLDERHGIRYVATGLGDTASDNVVVVRVDADGGVRLSRVPLVDEDMPELEECGLAFWEERFPAPNPPR